MSSAHDDLLRIHQQLFRRNRQEILRSVEVRDPHFVRYEKTYQRAVGRYQRRVSQPSLLQSVERADMILCGDYHTCAQSQRDFLRFIKAAQSRKRPLVLGLELLHQRSQPLIDAYLAGDLTTETFLAKTGMRSHWVFDLWPHFAPIFEFARYHRIPIFGIDAAGRHADLASRDVATGALLADLAIRHPKHQLFVLIGDMHLAPEHLPAQVERALAAHRATRRLVLLYQNSEAIHWQLVRRGIEHTTAAVQIAPHAFCRMHTPPVVYQQSYLNWLEHEEGEIDFADARQQFIDLVGTIARFLRVRVPAGAEQLTVYTCGDLRFLTHLQRSGQHSAAALRAIAQHILRSESYILPQQRVVYLGKLSINHAAEEAAHYLKFLCSGPEIPRTRIDAFFANILHEALGFFGSKLLNSRRKCLHESDIARSYRFFSRLPQIPRGRQLEARAVQFVYQFLQYEKRGAALAFRPLHQLQGAPFLAVTHLLGYMVGERLFYAALANKIGRTAIRQLFHDTWNAEGTPYTIYRELRKKLADIKIPARM